MTRYLVGALGLLLLVLAWWWATDLTRLLSPFVLPSPGDVLDGLNRIRDGYMGRSLGEHLLASLTVMVSGFALALLVGVSLGVLMAWFAPLDRLFGPLIAVLRPIPPPAWIPLAILWFGIGLAGKTFIVFVAAVVPVLVNSYVGCKETPDHLIKAARTLGAGDRIVLWSVVLPSALPMILTGTRISLGIAWATIVAAELVVADRGLGYLIMSGYRNFEANIMAAGMILIGLIGAAMNVGFSVLERRALRSREDNR